jgi:predicted HD superfamily hydrolase involved in NAD metabolism
MDYTNAEDIRKMKEYLEKHLTAKRMKHSMGVVKMAGTLAEIYGEDVQKARFTGLVHDIAKCKTPEEMDEAVRKYGLPDEYLGTPQLAHSKVGAAMLKEDFGITDEDILNGVSYHTTGRRGMSTFEEIIYVSDAIEENRPYKGAAELRKLACRDLDACCLEVMDFCLESIQAKGHELDFDTVEARKYIQEKINSGKGKEE